MRSEALSKTIVEKLNLMRSELQLYIQEQLPVLFPEVHEEISYMIRGGKFIRGALALFSADIYKCDKVHALPIAMAIELMHASSLVYDDISDSTEIRRDQPSLWKKYGIDEAVTIPHVAMATAILLIARHGGPDAVAASMNAWRQAAVGQLWDLRVKKGIRITAPYRDVVSKKTGEVFGAACILPLLATEERERASALRQYGVTLGAAYQVVDDMSDLSRGAGDSGSAILLLEESRGDYLQHGSQLLKQLLTELLHVSVSLPAGYWLLAVETLGTFAAETGGEVREHVLRVLREFKEGPRAPI